MLESNPLKSIMLVRRLAVSPFSMSGELRHATFETSRHVNPPSLAIELKDDVETGIHGVNNTYVMQNVFRQPYISRDILGAPIRAPLFISAMTHCGVNM